MFCLDSNIVIGIFRGDGGLKNKCKIFMEDGVEGYITSITLCELYKGAYLSKEIEKNLLSIKDFISSVKVLDFTNQACEFFGKEFARLQKIGKTPCESDLMIASIAKTHNLILITRDKKDFQNFDIRIEEW